MRICLIPNSRKTHASSHQCTKMATVKPVYKGHSMKPENVPFMSRCPLYRGYNYMHYL